MMTNDTAEVVKETISHAEAYEIMKRMCNSHFNNSGEHMRASIPANPRRDDDLRMHAYIRQQEVIHAFSTRDIPATPEVTAEIFERIGRATLRLFVDACRAEGLEVTVKLAEKSLRESSGSLDHG